MWLEIRWSHSTRKSWSYAAPAFAFLVVKVSHTRNILQWFRAGQGLLLTQEGSALNLNKDDEVKHCSMTGNQQDMASQPYSTVTFSPVLSVFSLNLPFLLTHCCTLLSWHPRSQRVLSDITIWSGASSKVIYLLEPLSYLLQDVFKVVDATHFDILIWLMWIRSLLMLLNGS